jgi:hypothetical protein
MPLVIIILSDLKFFILYSALVSTYRKKGIKDVGLRMIIYSCMCVHTHSGNRISVPQLLLYCAPFVFYPPSLPSIIISPIYSAIGLVEWPKW